MPLFRSLKISAFLLLVSLLVMSTTLRAEEATFESLSERVSRLETTLQTIQTQQTQILEKQKELAEKLDTVKVWARRG